MKQQDVYTDEEDEEDEQNTIEGLKIICEGGYFPYDYSTTKLIQILLSLIAPEEIDQYLNCFKSTFPDRYNALLTLVDNFRFEQEVAELEDLLEVPDNSNPQATEILHELCSTNEEQDIETDAFNFMIYGNTIVNQTGSLDPDAYPHPPTIPLLNTCYDYKDY